MKEPNQPSSIKNIIESALQNLSVETKFNVYPLWKAWQEIVGAGIADKSEPMSLKNQILTVGVEHPAWIQELNLLKPKILEKIGIVLPKIIVKNIVFKVKKEDGLLRNEKK